MRISDLNRFGRLSHQAQWLSRTLDVDYPLARQALIKWANENSGGKHTVANAWPMYLTPVSYAIAYDRGIFKPTLVERKPRTRIRKPSAKIRKLRLVKK